MASEIFILNTSEDGLYPFFYTTVRGLYNGITKTGYEPEVIEFSGFSKTYSYKNLCEAIEQRRAKAFPYVCDILCEDRNSIEINIFSKDHR